MALWQGLYNKVKREKIIPDYEKPDNNKIPTKTATQAAIELSDKMKYADSTVDDVYNIIKGAMLHPDLSGGRTTHWVIREFGVEMAVLKSIKELNGRIEKLEEQCKPNPKK